MEIKKWIRLKTLTKAVITYLALIEVKSVISCDKYPKKKKKKITGSLERRLLAKISHFCNIFKTDTDAVSCPLVHVYLEASNLIHIQILPGSLCYTPTMLAWLSKSRAGQWYAACGCLIFSLARVLTYVSDIICPASYHLAWRFNYRDKCVCPAICSNRVCLQEPPVTYTNTVSRTHTEQHLPHLVLPLHCQAVLWSACSFNRTDLLPQTVREPIHRIAYTPTGACSKVCYTITQSIVKKQTNLDLLQAPL